MIDGRANESESTQALSLERYSDAGRLEGAEQLRDFMGLRFLDQSIDEIAELLISAAKKGRKQQVYFVNAHCINVAASNSAYAGILQTSPYLFADGVGMALAARLWGVRIENNVNGTDLFPLLCQKAAREGLSFAFLGSKNRVAIDCAKRMCDKYPGLKVVWIEHGYLPPEEEDERIEVLNSSGARMLFVAKGVPGQEIWIDKNAGSVAVPVILGVGALFDFYSGAMKRAPLFLRNLRLEWLYRLFMEPSRLFMRYIVGNPQFIFRVIRRRIAGIRLPP